MEIGKHEKDGKSQDWSSSGEYGLSHEEGLQRGRTGVVAPHLLKSLADAQLGRRRSRMFSDAAMLSEGGGRESQCPWRVQEGWKESSDGQADSVGKIT